jgi:hypothetical protein
MLTAIICHIFIKAGSATLSFFETRHFASIIFLVRLFGDIFFQVAIILISTVRPGDTPSDEVALSFAVCLILHIERLQK